MRAGSKKWHIYLCIEIFFKIWMAFIFLLRKKINAGKRFSAFAKATADRGKKGWSSVFAGGYAVTSWGGEKWGCCKTQNFATLPYYIVQAQISPQNELWLAEQKLNKPSFCFLLKTNLWAMQKASVVRHTFTGSNIVSAAQTRRGLLSPPWPPLLIEQLYPA